MKKSGVTGTMMAFREDEENNAHGIWKIWEFYKPICLGCAWAKLTL